MVKFQAWAALINAMLVGLLAGLSATTGYTLDPQSITINVTSRIIQYFNLPQATQLWNGITFIIYGLGIVSIILEISLIISTGLPGIAIALLGAGGTFLFITGRNPGFGIIMVIAGAVIATLALQEN